MKNPCPRLDETTANGLLTRPQRIFWAALVSLLGIAIFIELIRITGGNWVCDYLAFWVAAKALGQHQAALLYDPNQFAVLLAQAHPGYHGVLGWFYPPLFLLYLAPLAALPFLPGLLLFDLLGILLLVVVLKRILPQGGERQALPFLLSAPALWINLMIGQNTLFMIALGGASLLLHRRRPVLSGLLLGILCVKPQFATVLLILYFFSPRRTAFWVAIGSAVGLYLTGGWLTDLSLLGWWHSLAVAQQFAQTRIPKALISWFGAFTLLGIEPRSALLLQGIIAVVVLLHTVRVWRSDAPDCTKAGVACLATLLVSPYMLYYDSLGWVLVSAFRAGSPQRVTGWERFLLTANWTFPLLSLLLANHTGLQLTPLLEVLSFSLFWRQTPQRGWENREDSNRR